jgi:fatty acid desaturase
VAEIADTPHVGAMKYGDLAGEPLFPRAHYVRELRGKLPPDAFERASSRLVAIPIHVAIIAVSIVAIAGGWLPWPVVPLVSLVIGLSFAGLTFVGHELMHGAIVHGKRTQQVLGWITFLPFMLSPRLWSGWHNRVHHATANFADDPDAYATIERYRERSSTRFSVDMFSLGGRRWRGVLSLILGFTVQSADQLFMARSHGTLSPREHRIAFVETGLGVLAWSVVAALVGFVPFLFVFVLPLLVANACVMAFILTNHNLSPRVTIDDPLVTGLSVTTPRAIEWITLGFGYHVEHHLFPAMSTRHAPAVRALVEARWPERYKSMPLREALGRLHRTGRVYLDATTLYDPATGATFPTLMPGELLTKPSRVAIREPAVCVVGSTAD